MQSLRFEIESGWDGSPLRAGEFARLNVGFGRAGDDLWGPEFSPAFDPSQGPPSESLDLLIQVDSAEYGDPAPDVAPGRCEKLWEFEVVELFLLGEGERYLEIELGPHGHYLGLELEGRRSVVDQGVPIAYETKRFGNRFEGRACVPGRHVPRGLFAANAYAIHGRGEARRYLAASPVPGREPDFHRLDCFPPLSRFERSLEPQKKTPNSAP